jgi:thioredoxin reductase
MGRMRDLATCLDCGERRLVSHKEWIRASRPRCFACGGTVEPSSQAAISEHASHVAAQKADQSVRDAKTNRTKGR